jgi:hypothetical protein
MRRSALLLLHNAVDAAAAVRGAAVVLAVVGLNGAVLELEKLDSEFSPIHTKSGETHFQMIAVVFALIPLTVATFVEMPADAFDSAQVQIAFEKFQTVRCCCCCLRLMFPATLIGIQEVVCIE